MSTKCFFPSLVRCGWTGGLLWLATLSLSLWAAPSFSSLGTATNEFHYAPNREINLLHLALDVTPDFRQRTVAGKATFKFKPIALPLAELRLDGRDLRVQSVTSTEPLAGWQATLDKIVVTFAQPLPPDQEATVVIDYSAAPKEGLYFRTRELGYRPEDEHLFSQGEADLAHAWYPCFDAPNAKFTTDITCRVPEDMVVLSNGRLVSREKDPATGLWATRWAQEKPHTTYLMSLVAGHFKQLETKYRDVPLGFWTPPSGFEYAPNTFWETTNVLAYFEKQIGLPYPWVKYDQVCVQDFVAGGMENTSITTLMEETLHPTSFENLRSSQGLVAHELAHQWFGDLVTCKDWSHLWLNEGFATFYEHLYEEFKFGREDLLYRFYQDARMLVNHPDQTTPIVRRDYATPDDQFNHLNYTKGSWVLHMLRSQLGPELYRRCILTYLSRHQFGNVTTDHLNQALEEVTGRSFDRFFDQWVYHASQPELNIAYEWNEPAKLAHVTIRQDQKLSDRVLLFEFPFAIRFGLSNAVVNRQVTVRQKSEDFYFPLPQAPRTVQVNADLGVLAKISFDQPTAMLYAQLDDAGDMLGRLRAVESLGDKRERGAVARLQKALNQDSFYGVRIAAAKALRDLGTDEAFDALRGSLAQSDARVRQQVVTQLGGFFREPAADVLLHVLDTEKNPEILSAAIQALGTFPQPKIREKLLGYLKSNSFRNQLAVAALGAMKTQDDPAYLAPALACLEKRQAEFNSRGFAQGLDALGWLAREQTNKDKVRGFLVAQAQSLRQRVQLAAINALGVLGDAKAVPFLERLASAPPSAPEKQPAEKAIERIRSQQKTAAELGTLRGQMLSLQKENQELRRDVDTLKKKFEAILPAGKTNAAAAKPK